MYDLYVREVPVKEDTCPGPSALLGRVASSFPRRLYLPSISNRSPFANNERASNPWLEVCLDRGFLRSR